LLTERLAKVESERSLNIGAEDEKVLKDFLRDLETDKVKIGSVK
jgi:hypothetical protein